MKHDIAWDPVADLWESFESLRRFGHQTTATMGLMAGFATMMLMDVALA